MINTCMESYSGKSVRKPLSGSSLKAIACGSMFLDHLAAVFLADGSSAYLILRGIGRIAFPIYCFLLAEGFVYTKNRKKYAASLAIFAVISQPAWDYLHSGTFIFQGGSVMLTLFFGLLGMCAWDHFTVRKKKTYLAVAYCTVLFGTCIALKTDYMFIGFTTVLVFHIFRERKLANRIPFTYTDLFLLVFPVLGLFEGPALFAVPLIHAYNGQRGFIRRKSLKYAFYAFYPLHMYVFCVLKYFFYT